MVRASPETVTNRLTALRESPTFVVAAAKLGEALSTLKTWARRNDALIKKHYPQYTYDGLLELSEGQLLQRRHSLSKASRARWLGPLGAVDVAVEYLHQHSPNGRVWSRPGL